MRLTPEDHDALSYLAGWCNASIGDVTVARDRFEGAVAVLDRMVRGADQGAAPSTPPISDLRLQEIAESLTVDNGSGRPVAVTDEVRAMADELIERRAQPGRDRNEIAACAADIQNLQDIRRAINRTAYHGGLGLRESGRYLATMDRLLASFGIGPDDHGNDVSDEQKRANTAALVRPSAKDLSR